MKTQQITLKNKEEVIIDYDSKGPCKQCNKEVFKAAGLKKLKPIYIELVSLAEWDVHECKGG